MFPARYFSGTYFAPRFWAKVGATTVVAYDLREAIQSLLGSDATLTALAAVYPGSIPIQQTLPAVAWTVEANPREHGTTGANGIAQARVAYDVAAWKMSEILPIKVRLEQLLDGKRWTALGTEVVWSEQIDESDQHEPPVDASDRWLYRTIVRYRVKHRVHV